jgi:CheY-like chemotaxis protein
MSSVTGILIVQGSAASSEPIRATLEWYGFNDIEQLHDAQAALRRLCERSFALVICDWQLVGMSGLELLRSIRQDETLHEVGVLLTSANAHPQLAETARRLGADAFLLRPFGADEFAAVLKNAIKRSPR